jgi:hypothetical protein
MAGGFHGAGHPFGGLVGFFPLFGIVFIAIAVFQGLRGIAKSHHYQEAEARYQQRRQAAMNRGEQGK